MIMTLADRLFIEKSDIRRLPLSLTEKLCPSVLQYCRITPRQGIDHQGFRVTVLRRYPGSEPVYTTWICRRMEKT